MKDDRLAQLAYEINRLRRSVLCLCWIVSLSALFIILAIWKPELILALLILLALLLGTGLIAASIGLGLGKSIRALRDRRP